MKILKLELQNINSLKSDSPIVIDFESDQFRDVGLYAITGSTGAGKTTLLDTITIALYHQVPRFKRPNVKASLVDVVSYGAGKALARITFENAGERFEAQWSIRLVDKKGKRLTNYKEEVRFKNLTTEVILGEKKTEVRLAVEKVTQLNYDQFLRSVMLAQGDFASFLSAPSKDKATLLEQITGEDIYKKIGDAINGRKGDEDKKLDAIRSKINNLDLLTTEQEEDLSEEKIAVNVLIKTLDADLEQTSKRQDWYERNKTLLADEEQLDKDFELLTKAKEDKQPSLDALSAHKKAEPYKELIHSLKRAEQEIKDKNEKLSSLDQELKELIPLLEHQEKEKNTCETKLQEVTQNFKEWLPKLEQVSGLDVGIKTAKEENKELEQEVKTLNGAMVSIADDINLTSKNIEQKELLLDELKQTIEKQKVIPEIEQEFNSWSIQLTERKKSLEDLKEDTNLLAKKRTELTITKEETLRVKKQLGSEQSKIEQIEEELSLITDLLKAHSLEDLLEEKEQLSTQKHIWTQFESLAKTFAEQTVLLEETELSKKECNAKKKRLSLDDKSLKKSVEEATISLKDAQNILALEQKIASLETERQNLIEGEPCALCGSTEHPYVSHYSKPELSVSEKRVKEREEKLTDLTTKLHDTELELASTSTFLEVQNKRVKDLSKELTELKADADELDLTAKIDDLDSVSIKVKELEKALDKNTLLISEAQSHLEQKNKKDKILQDQKEVINKLKNELTELETEEKLSLQNLEINEKELESLAVEIKDLEDSLTSSFDEYGIKLPKPEQTEQFIEKVKDRIAEYGTNQKKLDTVSHKISESRLTLKNDQEKLTEKTTRCRTTQEELKNEEQKLSQLLSKRSNLLSLETSVEQKRTELQTVVDRNKADFKLAEDNFIGLVSQQKVKKKESENKTNEINKLDLLWKKENTELSDKIAQGTFDSKEEVYAVLLPLEEETKIERIKEKINKQSISLQALKEKLSKDFEDQEQNKDFEQTEEEITSLLTEQQSTKKQHLRRLGEIAEKIKLNEQIKDRNKETVKEIKIQEKELKKWTDLIRLIGGSKDAFNTYVQRLTLQNLIHLANIHLSKLNKRYSLHMKEAYKTGEELNFNIIDHYQMDEIRYIDTSSGGEKFLISLALALGLSDLASHNVSIDSLFIDEGFGTLDNHTLESVISTLETLQSQGKTIGIISHVENLKERISTQIQVSKQQNGVSTVEVFG